MKNIIRAATLTTTLFSAFTPGTYVLALGNHMTIARAELMAEAALPTGTVIVLSIIGIFILIGIFMLIRLLRED
ncbi:MAG TPA: hypothetical protein PK078_02215 [Anaerolineales bacterium]|nr:hypothetical protein [Anaerolineales bacterium]HNA88211.1 hypothetical protein [Anaerolineales bacterium]HNB36531.1 hypothetical protein [Anaerolineales bacterium]HNC09376.1 hypothetical protein [Anaerolineales bacterium]